MNSVDPICDYDILFKNFINLYSVNVIRVNNVIEICIQDSLCISSIDVNNKPVNVKINNLSISDIENILTLMIPDEETGEYNSIILDEYTWKYAISDELDIAYSILYKDHKPYAIINNDNTIFTIKCLTMAYDDLNEKTD